jgi:hypothetical protein
MCVHESAIMALLEDRLKEGMGGASRGYEFDWGALYAHMEVSR